MIRPQDLATKGTGRLVANKDSKFILNGIDTKFTQEVGARDLVVLHKTLKFEVAEVISDTELKLKVELNEEALHFIVDEAAYKIIPHIDQSTLYEKVHERLDQGGCIVIFPEGGSHDRSEMLPLKAGFAIMALGAMAENKNLKIKIVPVGKDYINKYEICGLTGNVGLNYFHPHRFRSRAVVSYGAPISIDPELVEKYAQGGAQKREAIASLLDDGYDGLKSVTVNAPNYDTLMVSTNNNDIKRKLKRNLH